jgi:hypothetical protein
MNDFSFSPLERLGEVGGGRGTDTHYLLFYASVWYIIMNLGRILFKKAKALQEKEIIKEIIKTRFASRNIIINVDNSSL